MAVSVAPVPDRADDQDGREERMREVLKDIAPAGDGWAHPATRPARVLLSGLVQALPLVQECLTLGVHGGLDPVGSPGSAVSLKDERLRTLRQQGPRLGEAPASAYEVVGPEE